MDTKKMYAQKEDEKGPGLLMAGIVAALVITALVVGGVLIFGSGADDTSVAEAGGTAAAGIARSEPAYAGADAAAEETIPAAFGREEKTAVAAAAIEEETRTTPVTYAEAEAAYFEHSYAEATGLFAAYTVDHPKNAMAHYMLGLSFWKEGKNGEAENALRAALELDPDHVKSLTNLSRVLLDEGRSEEALEPIDLAIDIDPLNGDAYRVRGRMQHNLGKTEEAIASYERAVEIDDRDAWALNNLGLIFIETERFEDAIAPLARAVSIQSDNARFQNNLGMALERTGHYEAAEEAYALALEADGSYGKAVVNLTRVEVLDEDPELPEIDLATLAESFVVQPARAEETEVVEQIEGAELAAVDPETGDIGSVESEVQNQAAVAAPATIEEFVQPATAEESGSEASLD
jgi:tetratricopeptide (TPR) repeat protein